MSSGVPTVATTGSALEEMIADAGTLFAPGDADACARELESVLDDPALRSKLTRAGVARATELNWDKSAEGHREAYARAIAHASS